MNRNLIILTALGLIMAGPAAFAGGKNNPIVHRVSVGGADACEALGQPNGCDGNFSMAANEWADGSVKGQWQDTFAGGGEGVHIAIDCLNVIDNGVVVGGEVTHGNYSGEDATGRRAMTAVVDNGTSAKDPLDSISYTLLVPDGSDCHDYHPLQFTALFLTHGQVKVR